MRVLVTGVGGFVGTALARALVAAGDEVAGTYLGPRPEVAGVDLRPADILQPDALEPILSDFGPEAIVHLAGFSHVGESWKRPGMTFQVNVLGVENVLRVAGDARFLLASSAEVYGRVPEEEQPIGEDRLVAPRNPYALTKAAAERLTLAAGGIVVRMFNIVGPGQAETFALPSFARQLASGGAAGRVTLRVGNLEARRDFLHLEDAVAAYSTLIREGERGGVYNLGGGEDMSLRQALDLLIEIAGVEADIEIDPRRLRPIDIELTRADNRRLKALGWSPRKTVRQALVDLWETISRGG